MMLQNLIDDAWCKCAYASIMYMFAWVIGPSSEAIMSVGILCLLDFGLGFYRAMRGDLGGFKREKFYSGIQKFTRYMIFFVAARATDTSMTGLAPVLSGKIASLALGYIAIGEFLSISAHLAQLGTRLPSKLIYRVRGYRDGMFDCIEKKKDSEE